MVVGKDDELGDIDDESLARVRLIADRKRQLEEATDQVRQDIRGCFNRITETLRGRERQLLRQVEAIHRQQLSLVQSNSELLPASITAIDTSLVGEEEVLERLRTFGKIELANSVYAVDAEPYKAEEYIEAGEDYVSFDKSLKSESETLDVSSVLKARTDATGKKSKAISINLNCTSCEACKFETQDRSPAVATTIKKLEEVAITPTTPSTSSERSPFQDTNVDIFVLPEPESPSTTEESAHNEDLPSESEDSKNASCEQTVESAQVNEPVKDSASKTDKVVKPNIKTVDDDANDASKPTDNDDDEASASVQDKLKDAEHPKQIQQWLQQILAETETEPMIHEFDHLSKIPNTRLYCTEFPVET